MSPQTPSRYYVQISRRAFGPFSPETLKEMIARGRIEKTTLLSVDKQSWMEAGDMFGIFSNGSSSNVDENATSIAANASVNSSLDDVSNANTANRYFLSPDGRECSGSFTTRELFDLLREKKISSDALVWRHGDVVSHKICENREIQQDFVSFQAAPDPFMDEAQSEERTDSSPTPQEIRPATRRVAERIASKIKTRFISAWICLGVATITIPVAFVFQYYGVQTVSFAGFSLGAFVYLFAALALIGTIVFGSSFLHAFWSALPQEYARANPDEAVAFLFVPGFGIYWIFQALYGGAIDANEALKNLDVSNANGANVLFVSPGWALATGVFFDLGGPFNPVSGLFFLLCLGVTTVQMKNAALKLDSLNVARCATSRR